MKPRSELRSVIISFFHIPVLPQIHQIPITNSKFPSVPLQYCFGLMHKLRSPTIKAIYGLVIVRKMSLPTNPLYSALSSNNSPSLAQKSESVSMEVTQACNQLVESSTVNLRHTSFERELIHVCHKQFQSREK